MAHSREEVLGVLRGQEVVVVATAAGGDIRTRMMHFAADDDFTIYLATMKGDPNTLQMTYRPAVSLLAFQPQADINASREAEITGSPAFVRDAKEREEDPAVTAG